MTATPSPSPGHVVGPRATTGLAGEDLELAFADHTVVSKVNVELTPGRVTGLVGPNGSGKSTLLRGLARLHRVRSGTLTIRKDTAEPLAFGALSAQQFAREVTLFAQSRSAPQGLSVREVVSFGRHPHRRRFSGLTIEDQDAVERAMHATGLVAMAGRSAGELSGGELQRVWLAACLAQETGVVLLDEPTNHLDLRYQVETLDLIRDLAEDRGAAVGVVLHDLDHAALVADHLLLLHEGRVLAAGQPQEVLTADNIGTAYGVHVDVDVDPRSGRLRIDPISRRPIPRTPHPTPGTPSVPAAIPVRLGEDPT